MVNKYFVYPINRNCTYLFCFCFIDGWMQQPTLNAISSPTSDYYDSFNSTSSHSVKQEPSTPNFTPAEVINNLMFIDESSNQMKTEYNAGKKENSIYKSCLYTKIHALNKQR
jgi:hypothetical protein